MVKAYSPEALDSAVEEYLSWPKERQEKFELLARSTRARELGFGVDGFKEFYWCIWRREMPPYASAWVESFASGEWTILECFRGSTKSTTLSVTFPAYCLGKEPWTSVLIVQANDDTASKTSSLIANIIKHYVGWKACFPQVVPDEERGWGAKGYYIKDLGEIGEDGSGYGRWLERCSVDHMKDPSFVGAGIGSADIVGMHPRRLFFDDIHDLGNSAFPRERQKIVETVRANVLPVITKPGEDKPFIGVSCTPWDKTDAYHDLYDTGLFIKKTTPLFRYVEKGDIVLEGRPIELAWPEGFSLDAVAKLMQSYRGSRTEFARMYLCDLEAAKHLLYSYSSYDAEKIDYDNPVVGGVDYASVYLPTAAAGGGRSHFAMAYVVKQSGGAVVADGIVEQCTQAQAEVYVMRAQNSYPRWQHCVIESDGVGAQFVQLLQRNPQMRVIPRRTSEIFRGTKEKRQYEILSPLLDRAILRVSNANTLFLNCFRSYLENYPNLDRHAPEWDVADAVLWAVVGMPEIHALSKAVAEPEEIYHEEIVDSPWASLTRK